MIKTASELIAEAKLKADCLDIASARALYDQSENAVIIDVREASSWAESRLRDSVNIPRGLIEMKIQKLCSDSDALILTHCAAGGRATLAALTLQEMGYTNVHAITAKFEDIQGIFG